MSANAFLAALQQTLKKEGRLVDHKADRGGVTDYGISLRFLKGLPDLDGDLDGDGHVTEADITALTPGEVARLYRKYFWDHYRLDEINHDLVAIKAFDLLVNMRSKPAVKIIQRALRACNKPVLEDGLLGSKTFAAINDIRDQLNPLAAMRSEAYGHYRLIIAADPTQGVFHNGWKNRAYS